MDIAQPAEGLVDERLEVCVGERLARTDDGVQVGLHEFLVEVDLIERPTRMRYVHIVQACDILVPTEMAQQLDLAQSALGQDALGEDIGHLLDRNAFPRAAVRRSGNTPIGTLPELFADLIAAVDQKGLVQNRVWRSLWRRGFERRGDGSGLRGGGRHGGRANKERDAVASGEKDVARAGC